MDGVELNVRFALKPNNKSLCGPECAKLDFSKYILGEISEEQVKNDLLKFEGFVPYLKAISNKNNLNFFDSKVAEAYWIGNNLLENFSVNDLKKIILNLGKRGLVKSMCDELNSKLVEGFVPHHSFHVFYVGPGNTSGKLDPLFEFKETCRVSCGKVIQISEDKLKVERVPIELNKGKLVYGIAREIEVEYKPQILDVNEGDLVAIHWNFALMKLTNEQVRNLEKYTTLTLDLINKINH